MKSGQDEHSKRDEARQRALVALAVLLDGRDAGEILKEDLAEGEALGKACARLAELPPELRLPLAGTMLRKALAELAQHDGDTR